MNTAEIGFTKEVDLNEDIVKIQGNEDTNDFKDRDDVFAVEVDDRGIVTKEGTDTKWKSLLSKLERSFSIRFHRTI
ncbi:MAG TPA: hypothetical protein VK078_00045 [Pseudogracilibacillus sp.]|nr:hypothetical protein [Pseudogracilibacillus sp.]